LYGSSHPPAHVGAGEIVGEKVPLLYSTDEPPRSGRNTSQNHSDSGKDQDIYHQFRNNWYQKQRQMDTDFANNQGIHFLSQRRQRRDLQIEVPT